MIPEWWIGPHPDLHVLVLFLQPQSFCRFLLQKLTCLIGGGVLIGQISRNLCQLKSMMNITRVPNTHQWVKLTLLSMRSDACLYSLRSFSNFSHFCLMVSNSCCRDKNHTLWKFAFLLTSVQLYSDLQYFWVFNNQIWKRTMLQPSQFSLSYHPSSWSFKPANNVNSHEWQACVCPIAVIIIWEKRKTTIHSHPVNIESLWSGEKVS